MLTLLSCYASQTRKSELGTVTAGSAPSTFRYRVRMETTRTGPHERDLCQLGSIASLVRRKQQQALISPNGC